MCTEQTRVASLKRTRPAIERAKRRSLASFPWRSWFQMAAAKLYGTPTRFRRETHMGAQHSGPRMCRLGRAGWHHSSLFAVGPFAVLCKGSCNRESITNRVAAGALSWLTANQDAGEGELPRTARTKVEADESRICRELALMQHQRHATSAKLVTSRECSTHVLLMHDIQSHGSS